MYILNLEIAAFLLSLLCFIFCLTARRQQYIPPKGFAEKLLDQHFVFLIMLVTNLLSAAASVTGTFLQEKGTDSLRTAMYIFHMLYFIFHSTLSVSFAMYIMNVTGTSLGKKARFYIPLLIPYVISELLIFTNSFTGLAFYMDAANTYHRGPLMVILYAAGAFYVITGVVIFFRHKQAISGVDSKAVFIFILLAALGILVQAVRSDLMIELFFEALACLVLMFLIEEKSGLIDPVTGVQNRIAFFDTNRRLMEAGQSYNIIFIKLTNTDQLSKRFGTRELENMVTGFASWLKSEFSARNVFTYHVSDFAIVLDNNDPEIIKSCTGRIVRHFDEYHENNRAASFRAEAVVCAGKVPEDIYELGMLEDLLSTAYVPKKAGTAEVSFEEFSSGLLDKFYERLLRRALENNTFYVKYQPIWSVNEKCTVSAEALLRVNEKELETLSPEVYIPVAEKTGLIRDIGFIVFEQVCKFLADEKGPGSSLEFIELNLSVYQFMYSDLVERFEEIRSRYNVPAEKINLEITESTASHGAYNVLDAVAELKKIGYTLSLDDFGTGYSNIIRLMDSNFRNVKIDKSVLWKYFGKDMDAGSGEALKDLVAFVKGFCAEVIQEGVETKEQLEAAIGCGCDLIQGYYFSRPIEETQFREYLENEKTRQKAAGEGSSESSF